MTRTIDYDPQGTRADNAMREAFDAVELARGAVYNAAKAQMELAETDMQAIDDCVAMLKLHKYLWRAAYKIRLPHDE
jgi:hypothetical protein